MGSPQTPAFSATRSANSDAYQTDITKFAAEGLTALEIYERLAITDIQHAADLFRPLYDASAGGDGYVSLEVNPHLANDTEGTIQEALRLWEAVDRPNLMVKIPGTEAGLPAIADAIAAGLNINVTLIFSVERYRGVIDAFVSGLEARLASGAALNQVASVASFFVSRVDSKIDPILEGIIVQEVLLPRRPGIY